MACGDCGNDDKDEEELFRYFEQLSDPHWQDIKPNPNSIWSKASDLLGDSIDGVVDLIYRAVASFSSLPVRLYKKFTGRNPMAVASRRYM